MKLFGASLGELLRHGSQFGLGVQEAGRQNEINRQKQAEALKKAEQEQLLAMALLDQRKASADLSRGRLKDLSAQQPKAPTQLELEGGLGNVMAEMPDAPDQAVLDTTLDRYRDWSGEAVRASLNRLRRQQASDQRAASSAARAGSSSGDLSRGELTANARGLAEDLALQMTSVSQDARNASGLTRADMERTARARLLAKYPALGTDEAGSIVRREFSRILDKGVGGTDAAVFDFVRRGMAGLVPPTEP